MTKVNEDQDQKTKNERNDFQSPLLTRRKRKKNKGWGGESARHLYTKGLLNFGCILVRMKRNFRKGYSSLARRKNAQVQTPAKAVKTYLQPWVGFLSSRRGFDFSLLSKFPFTNQVKLYSLSRIKGNSNSTSIPMDTFFFLPGELQTSDFLSIRHSLLIDSKGIFWVALRGL